MPNWVMNDLSITGTPEVIAQMKAQLSAPYEITHYNFIKDEMETVKIEQPFSFWNIIKPTNLDEYHDKPNEKQDTRNPNHWYPWNISHWGTKWDVREVQVSESPTSLGFGFDTAWAPPVEAIDRLAEQYPTASIELAYTEEQGWGGTIEWEDGTSRETDSYEYKCWNCDERFLRIDDAKFDEESGEHLCKETLVDA